MHREKVASPVKQVQVQKDLELSGWGLHEIDLEEALYQYYQTLDFGIKSSMAPVSLLIDAMSGGYDPHYFVWKRGPNATRVEGLIAFNVDTMLQKQT